MSKKRILSILLVFTLIFSNVMTVFAVNGNKLSIAISDVEMRAGESYTLTPEVKWNGSKVEAQSISYKVTKGDNTITVSKEGVITAKRTGEAKINITATYKDYQAVETVDIKVKSAGTASTTYGHMSIAVGTTDGYSLASKPAVVANGGEYNNQAISLGNVQSSMHNGNEYQSQDDYTFTTNTTFTVTATFVKNGSYKTETFVISDIANYNSTGKSFYEYCRLTNCDDNTGLDMKLTYKDLVENFYKTVYNVDGDTETITDDSNYQEGETVTVTSKVPDNKDGYVFAGWSYDGQIYKAGNTVSMGTEQIVFTAVWNETYTVSYDVDGTVTGDGVIYVTGDEAVVADAPSKDGYEFEGWEYDGKVYQPGEKITIEAEDVVLTADFTELFDVEYKVNGTVVSAEQVKSGATTTLMNGYIDSGKLIADSDKFVCWMIGDKEATAQDLENITADITLTAKLAKKTFDITYIVDGKVVNTVEDIEYGTNYTVADNYSKDGCDFSGWSTEAGTVINVQSDITITGTTSVKMFTITYVVKSGDSSEVVKTVENIPYNTNYEVEANYAEEGYNSSDWSTEAGTIINVKGNIVITCTKTIKTFTVKYFDKDGKEITKLTQIVNYGTELKQANGLGPYYVTSNNELDNIDASSIKYTFTKWMPQGTYTADDLASVKQDMSFKAAYWNAAVKVKYYVLNSGNAQPGEIHSYPSGNYSKGIEGTLDSFTKVRDENEVYKYLGTSVPTAEDFNTKYNLGIDTEARYIKWYVIKQESDGWHVDGIVTEKPTLMVKYVDGEGDELAASKTTIIEPKSSGTVTPIEIEGYTAAENQNLSYTAGATGEIIVTVVYGINAHNLTITYKYDDGSKAFENYVGAYDYNDVYSVASEEVKGYTATIKTVEGTMGDSDVAIDVVYNRNDYSVTVNYVYEDGTPVMDENGQPLVKELSVKHKAGYNIETGQLTGYTADKNAVSGVIDGDNVTETVTYTKIKFNVTYYINNIVYGTDTVEYGEDYDINNGNISYTPAYGYEFTGWSTEDNTDNVTADIAVYGTTTETMVPVVINYVDGAGNPVAESYETAVAFGSDYEAESPEAEGYELSDQAQAVISGRVDTTDSIVVNVVYNKLKFTITYTVDGEVYNTIQAEYGDVVNIHDVEYTPEDGFTFSGWTTDADLTDGIRGNVTVIGTTEETIIVDEEDIPLDNGSGSGEQDEDEDAPDAVIKEDEMVVIDDEDVPLSGNVQTGDMAGTTTALAALLMSACAALTAVLGRKKSK